MNAVGPRVTAEQLALCQRLTPRIIDVTADYFTADRQHPYLDGLTSGGIIQDDHEHDNSVFKSYVITESNGFRDTLDPAKFSRIGIPESVALNGLMWVIMTDRHYYLADPQASTENRRQRDKLDYCFAHWDGSDWIVRRLIPDSEPGQRPWEDTWQASELKSNEVNALQVTASQTEDLHAIAQLFREDSYAFEGAIMSAAKDEKTLRMLDIGLKSPSNTQPYRTMPPYMHYYATAYQYLDNLLSIAHRVADGRSFELDLDGIMAATNYHRSSRSSTPEMLKGGENFPLGSMHPPIPPDMLRLFRRPTH